MSHYCHIHGSYEDWKDGCPECREAEERADERAREAEERAREADERAEERAREAEERTREAEERAEERAREAEFRRANPGEYECPSCLYRTLRRDASACPKCQRDVPKQYWANVRMAEEAAAKAEAARRAQAAAEWERTRPEREAREAKERAEREAREAKERAKRRARESWTEFKGYMTVYTLWLLPALVLWSLAFMAKQKQFSFVAILSLIPFANWLLLLAIKLYSMPPYNGFFMFGPLSRPAFAHFIPQLLLVWTVFGAIFILVVVSIKREK